MRCCDCFLSLHRSEGFGRGPAEAMFFGKPVIATGWSGNMDYMAPGTAFPVRYRLLPVGRGAYPFADGQVWACGELTGTLTLGPGETGQTVLTATDYDAWVGRFAAATGNLVWGVRLGDTGADACRDVEVLADGSVVTGGMEAGELVVRGFDAAGSPRFEKHATGTDVEVTDLALFADGSFAVSGLFSGGITFGAVRK